MVLLQKEPITQLPIAQLLTHFLIARQEPTLEFTQEPTLEPTQEFAQEFALEPIQFLRCHNQEP